MNRFKTKNGVTVHEYTKEHYNLYNMYKHYRRQYGYYAIDTDPPDPAYCALHKWYNGLSGEVTTVNRLKKLGLIQSDTFRAVELMHPDRVAYKPQIHFRHYKVKKGRL